MASKALKSEHRRTLRLGVQFSAGIREPGTAQRFQVEVIDLSVTGFRFETSFTLRPEQKIFVTIPGVNTLEAIVQWGRGYIYGAAFERPLYNAVFDHIAAKHRKIS